MGTRKAKGKLCEVPSWLAPYWSPNPLSSCLLESTFTKDLLKRHLTALNSLRRLKGSLKQLFATLQLPGSFLELMNNTIALMAAQRVPNRSFVGE